ncbi:MAG: hypothetical protein PVS2B1_24840 [Candidatus Dormibacteraceae bacterium]
MHLAKPEGLAPPGRPGRRPLLCLVMLLVACGGQPAASVPSPTNRPTVSSPIPSPSTSSTTCRLPILAGQTGQPGTPQAPGFFALSTLDITQDTDAGSGARFYDRQLKRWLPADPQAVSEDGSSYAYVDGDTSTSRLHLVDLVANKDRVLAEGGPWRLVGLQPDGAYVAGIADKSRGLWKVALEGGAPLQLTNDTRSWVNVSKGAAWASVGAMDPGRGLSDVFRLDLQTRQVTTWFARGTRSVLLGFDENGVPLIMNERDVNELWRVPSPEAGVMVWSGAPTAMGPYAPAALDGSVVWFSSRNSASDSGIYRYSAEKGVQLVATFVNRQVSVAGPCA